MGRTATGSIAVFTVNAFVPFGFPPQPYRHLGKLSRHVAIVNRVSKYHEKVSRKALGCTEFELTHP